MQQIQSLERDLRAMRRALARTGDEVKCVHSNIADTVSEPDACSLCLEPIAAGESAHKCHQCSMIMHTRCMSQLVTNSCPGCRVPVLRAPLRTEQDLLTLSLGGMMLSVMIGIPVCVACMHFFGPKLLMFAWLAFTTWFVYTVRKNRL